MKEESSFAILFYSSLKSKNTKTVIFSVLIHTVSVTEVAGPCRRATKLRGEEETHLLKRQMKRQMKADEKMSVSFVLFRATKTSRSTSLL